MQPFHNRSNPPPPSLFMRSAQRVARTLRNPAILDLLSWLIWLVAVVVFAFWTQAYYRAPAKPAWIGMTIRTSAFAGWALVIREWFALRIQRRRGQSPHRGEHRDDTD
jgi:hypothetical protein